MDGENLGFPGHREPKSGLAAEQYRRKLERQPEESKRDYARRLHEIATKDTSSLQESFDRFPDALNRLVNFVPELLDEVNNEETK